MSSVGSGIISTQKSWTSGLYNYEVLHDDIERLVSMKSGMYTIPGFDREDIAQEIRMMCLKALERYEPSKNHSTPFNYLARCVDNRLRNLLRDNGATRIDLILPYLGYARQDRPNRKGEDSIGLMVAETIMKMKASRRILFDIHSPRIRRVLGRSTELSALPLFAEMLSKRSPEVIVSPDAGSVLRVKQMAKLLDPRPELATIEKVRPRPNVAIAKRLHGDVRGKDVLILDDMIDTGGTLAEAVRLISLQGPRTVRVAATHGIFSGDARDRLARLPLQEILTTNTLPQVPHPKIRTLDIVPLLRDIL